MDLKERKKNLISLVSDLRVEANRIFKVAPDSIPPQVKVLLQARKEDVEKSVDDLLETVPEDQRLEFAEFMTISMDNLRKGHTELMESLSRRIQKEGEPRTPPRKFQGFKKRRGTW